MRSADWKVLLASLGMHPNSPAFTCLALKETFVEVALIVDAGQRSGALMAQWHMPPNQLLEFVVTHELGHAFCNDTNEAKANYLGESAASQKTLFLSGQRTVTPGEHTKSWVSYSKEQSDQDTTSDLNPVS